VVFDQRQIAVPKGRGWDREGLEVGVGKKLKVDVHEEALALRRVS
jgi:hypothetical protein